jgi:hypothetical protein
MVEDKVYHKDYPYFIGTFGENIHSKEIIFCSFTLKMEAVCSLEMLVNFYDYTA